MPILCRKQSAIVPAIIVCAIFAISIANPLQQFIKKDSSTQISSSVRSIELEKSRPDQYQIRDRLIGMLDQKNPLSIIDVLNNIQKNGNLRENCHEIAHDIGHKSFEYYGFSGALLLGVTPPPNMGLIGKPNSTAGAVALVGRPVVEAPVIESVAL